MATRKKKVQVFTVEKLSEYLEIINGFEREMWFRGHGKSGLYKLSPSLYRGREEKESGELLKVEYDMLKAFIDNGVALH